MRSLIFGWICALSLLGAGCQGSRSAVAYGNANSIIATASEALWAQVGDSVYAVMEPRILTVRDERTFELTHVSPEHEDWLKLRLWRQVLVIGAPSDPWISPLLASQPAPPSLPAIVERDNVWANGQKVTAIVLPENGQPEALLSMLPELHQMFDQRFRGYVHQRMFASGYNEALRDSLAAEAGFSLTLPQVYRTTRLEDAYFFRNDASLTSEDRNRTVLVTWRPGASEALTPEAVLAWRDQVARTAYEGGQTTERERVESRPLERAGGPGLEVQGIWRGSDEGYPTAGPFVTRVVACPAQDRTYLLDGWIYAPARPKYEYMLQLETILDSFGCGASQG